MASGGGPEAPPPLPPEITAFRKLVAANDKCPTTGIQQKFVKKLDNIPSVDLPAEEPCRSALNLAESGTHWTVHWPLAVPQNSGNVGTEELASSSY
jgi:hypothetical protein